MMRRIAQYLIVCLGLAGCAGTGTTPSEESTTTVEPIDQTSSTSEQITTTSLPITTTTEAATTTQQATTTTISAEQLAKAEAVGDIRAGEELFNSSVELTGRDFACSECHTFDGVDRRSPSLAGISAVAGERVEGLSDIEYLRESILQPDAHESGEWADVMPRTYAESLNEEQVNNLIAFLLTR